jgi:hypothetical protein
MPALDVKKVHLCIVVTAAILYFVHGLISYTKSVNSLNLKSFIN